MVQQKAAARRKAVSPLRRMDITTAYCMLIPSLVVISIFVIWPCFQAISKSFTDWNFYNTQNVGFLNYKRALNNPIFRATYLNMIQYVIFNVPISIIVPFLFAHCIKNLGVSRFSSFAKISLYIPGVIGGVIISLIGLLVLDYQGGLINNVIKSLGGQRINFLADRNIAKVAIVMTGFWSGFGGSTLYWLAGLNNVDDSYHEAAALDGCNAFQRMIYVTIPCMKNIFCLQIVNCVKGTLMMMDLPMMMTGGGPNNGTNTPVLYIYQLFNDTNVTMGYTVACSVLLMIVASGFTALVFYIVKSEKSME